MPKPVPIAARLCQPTIFQSVCEGSPRPGSNLASRQHPHGNADVDSSANQPAAATHLNGDIDSDEAGNQRDDKEDRIDASHQERSPQARENRRIKPMVLAKQDGENKRAKA